MESTSIKDLYFIMKISKLINLKYPLILASESPRRLKLLQQLGFSFTIQPANVDEDNLEDGLHPAEHVSQLAERKARAISNITKEKSIIIGADTIVVLDGNIMNKPRDKDHAFEMLKILSNRTHIVYTGIAVVESVSNRTIIRHEKTDVTFRELTDDEIATYVDSGSPMDKAGAYGIQDDFGAVFVSHIEGCYYNIVGLPLQLLYVTLRDFLK